MTGQEKTETVINRVCESINKLLFDTGKERIRVNLVAGYTAPDLLNRLILKIYSNMRRMRCNELLIQ